MFWEWDLTLLGEMCHFPSCFEDELEHLTNLEGWVVTSVCFYSDFVYITDNKTPGDCTAKEVLRSASSPEIQEDDINTITRCEGGQGTLWGLKG
jgi:hypothetical protein